MADFEGEDVLSEEELAHINAHAQFVAATVLVRDTGHHTMQHHLANMASSYDVPLDKGVIHAHHSMKMDTDEEALGSLMRLDDVCKPGNTLLWDLLQDDTAHLLPEGLIVEAEKVLCSLVCFSTDRCIRTQFIEACIENLANNR
ncbi:hypothetical protein NP493_4060g00004 [Ridgeia piscesae]|nr:hypothetical protein NP493_4060g00004 [Ridgeia piscesae]